MWEQESQGSGALQAPVAPKVKRISCVDAENSGRVTE